MNRDLLVPPRRLRTFAILLAIAAAFVTGMLAASPVASSPPEAAPKVIDAIDFTGVWTADDGGTYYVRQIENAVWWIGLDKTDGTTFSSVFHGTTDGAFIKGDWVDVPRGTNMNSGSLVMELVEGTSQALHKRESSGGPIAGVWSRAASSSPPKPCQQQPEVETKRRILTDGTIEIREPDGTVRKYHTDGSVTTTYPDGTSQRQLPNQAAKATPPLSLLSGSDLRPWLENHNTALLTIIKSRLTAGEVEHSVRGINSAERGKNLYEKIVFRTGAIMRLAR